jgi:hypothetical protein
LPPSLILEVLRITESEMDLRDLTRETEQARRVTLHNDYIETTDALFEEQLDLTIRTAKVIEEIEALPNARADFGRELGLLRDARGAMQDAEEKLGRPTTGPVTVAAETEAIEHLLRARRSKGGGGGGGNNPGGGLKKGQTEVSALALVGRSEDAAGKVDDREVAAVTGDSGRAQSAELQGALDRYFERLDGR